MAGWGAGELRKHERKALAGLSEYACPRCGAHLHQTEGRLDRYTCLNACHLADELDSLARFAQQQTRTLQGLPDARGRMW